MPVRCSVSGCPNGRIHVIPGIPIHYYRFPRISHLRQIWVKKCRRNEMNPDNARVCSIHFRDTDYQRNLQAELLGYIPLRRCLKKDVIPSLNLPQRIGPPRIKLQNKCAIVTCPNHFADFGKPLYFFKFPEDINMRKKWCGVCKLKSNSVTDTSELCSEHFLDTDYLRDLNAGISDCTPTRVKALRKHLKIEAIPSLKLSGDSEPPHKRTKLQMNSTISLKTIEQETVTLSATQMNEFTCHSNTEIALQNCSASSSDNPDFNSPFKLLDAIFSNSGIQNKLREANDNFLSKNGKSFENMNIISEQQESLNCSDILLKSSTTQMKEFASQNCSDSSIDDNPDFDSPNKLLDTVFSNSEIRNELQAANDNLFSKTGRSIENMNIECEQQECPNCSDMLLKSVELQKQLASMKVKISQLEQMANKSQNEVLQLHEQNNLLKEKLGEKRTAKLREEMEKVFNGVLNQAQIECLVNQAQKRNIIRKNIDGAIKLKPIGTYRLYNIPKNGNIF